MHVLIVVNGRTAWKRDIEQPQTVMVGSASTADIRLENSVAGDNHLELSFDGTGGWLCAHAPVIVGGQPVIGWAPLGELAEVAIGSSRILVHLLNHRSSADRMPLPASPVSSVGTAGAPAPAPAPKSVPGKHTGLTAIFSAAEVARLSGLPPAPAPKKRWRLLFGRTKPAPPKPAQKKPVKPPAKTAAPEPAKVSPKANPKIPAPANAPAKIPAKATPTVASGPDPMAGLAGMFALPAAEAVRPAAAATFGQRRVLGLNLRSWFMVMVSGAIGVVTFATREVPPASAGRNLGIQLIKPKASDTLDRTAAKKAQAVTPDKVKTAAEALISGDFGAALTLYRKLADGDASYVPFVQALRRRLSANCKDPALRKEPCL